MSSSEPNAVDEALVEAVFNAQRDFSGRQVCGSEQKPWTRQQIDRHMSAAERAQREEEEAAEAEIRAAERLEQERARRMVKPAQQAVGKIHRFTSWSFADKYAVVYPYVVDLR